ncbi:MAG: HAD-IA family hydrolase [Candidatus Omnitrophota bacterium]|nr:HAD-IA family hydrolase [Candidatus Omnitrophota bacterium]
MLDIKLVIFDLDGTLVDAYGAINSSFNYVMRKLGLEPQSVSTIRAAVGWGDSNLLKPYVPANDLKHALELYRNHHKHSLIKYSHLYPSVKYLLRYLKAKGYKLAVASNRPTEFSLILLRHLCLINFFDYVLCSDRLKYGKPHPQILNKIIKKFAVKKTQALYVGDMAIDAQAGRRARVKTVIVTGGSSSTFEIKREKPFRIISSIDRLAQLFKS